MAEFDNRGANLGSGGIASSPSPARGKVAFKAGDGEGGGGGVRTHLDVAGNRVSNGDCAPLATSEEIGAAQPDSPGLERGYSTLLPEGKAGIPRKTSIIKILMLLIGTE
uniref:Uncharacterized protein n=1 Tax=Sphaerodactylus townsendi TaxID=933632 RepID=A0ACB8FVS5_9SAUR